MSRHDIGWTPITEPAVAPVVLVDELARVERVGSVLRLLFTSTDFDRHSESGEKTGRRLEVVLAVPAEMIGEIAKVLVASTLTPSDVAERGSRKFQLVN